MLSRGGQTDELPLVNAAPLVNAGYEQGLTNADSVAIAVDFTAQLNDTGITAYGNTTENGLTEPVTGFSGQYAEYGRDAQVTAGMLIKVGDGNAGFDFTKLDVEGKAVAADADEWACVQDNVTGLVWEVKTTDGGLQYSDHTYSWYNSTRGNYGGISESLMAELVLMGSTVILKNMLRHLISKLYAVPAIGDSPTEKHYAQLLIMALSTLR